MKRFSEFSSRSIAERDRSRVRMPILQNGSEKWFAGEIRKIDYSYGFVRRDGDGHDIFIPSEAIGHVGLPNLSEGQRVMFTVGFNYRGPAVISMKT